MRIFAVLAMVALVLLIVFSVYSGFKLRALLNDFKLFVRGIFFWPVYLLMTAALVYFTRFGIVLVLYIGMIYILFDLLRLLFFLVSKFCGEAVDKKLRRSWSFGYQRGITPIFLAVGLILSAYYNAGQIIARDYEIELPHAKEMERELSIVFISDFHVGTSIHRKELEKIREDILAFAPDLILLGGDIFDERSQPEDKKNFHEIIGNLPSSLGTYYVHGNHDRRDDVALGMEAAGIKVLADEVVFLADSFYLAGRKDRSMNGRMGLTDLLMELDPVYPVLLLDHQPLDLELASLLGVSFQLSGHTHAGQLFPGNLLVGRFNEWDYGHKKIGDYQIIVSSGVGTWNFPLRLGSRSEFLQIRLRY